MQSDNIIVRLSGEIGVKSEWTRKTYERQLTRNIKHALKNANLNPDAVVRARGRIYVRTPQAPEAAQVLTRVFGISSISPAKQTTAELADITTLALEMAQTAVPQDSTFAVRCHRVGIHPYTSQDVCRLLGEKILDTFQSRNLKVNLTHPQATITVEVRDKEAYVYGENLQGVGGFPLGTQAKAVCLLSGGIDSPVACWLTMKRGSPQIPLYIDNAPYTDEIAQQKAIETARKLKEWSAGYMKKMYLVPNGENMKMVQQKTPPRFTCLLCKRLMYRIAERIAENEGALGIVTGEAIGEQASQTMHNLRAIDEAATTFPIHRPLLGFDKLETEVIARKIGTFEISIKKTQGCTAVPSSPATQAKLEAVKEAEAALDIPAMVDAALQAAQIVEL